MDSFIKKQQFNFIKKCLFDLNGAFRNCIDANIVDTTKACIQNKIYDYFTDLTEEQRTILDISKITDPLHIDGYIKDLDQYVYGMPTITALQINKVFKKEKKLKIPNLNDEDSKIVYLGWIDEAIRKLLIIYNLDGKFVGMACRLPSTNSNNTNICTLCNHVGPESEIAFVSPICKTSNPGLDSYKSIGFHVCLDSKACNDRITSTEKLENLLIEVNNIKKK